MAVLISENDDGIECWIDILLFLEVFYDIYFMLKMNLEESKEVVKLVYFLLVQMN